VRIIGGILKGRNIDVPKGLPIRPTTSFAGEALFNILNNYIDFENCSFLDLFSGTGHISLEFASRECKDITAVDSNASCIKFLKQTTSKFNLPITAQKADVFNFLKENKRKYDVVFADPPYDIENMEEVHQLVFTNESLNPNGILIMEHGPRKKLDHLSHFKQHRKYGNVHFTFFENNL